MATFVLIHGAWHGGWCFDDVRALLEAQGHKVITPDLPGMGGTNAELAAVTLAGWADFVSDICRAQNEPVILAGHSRGGIVISETAERVPDRVAALVYICAMMLPDDMSRAQWRERNGQPNPEFAAIQRDHPGGHAKIIDTTHAIPVFAQLSPREKAEAAMARLVAEPDGPRTEPLHLTTARYGSVPRHYIESLHDRTIPIADQRMMQAFQPCASVTALDADHSPFLSAPLELADALVAIAQGMNS